MRERTLDTYLTIIWRWLEGKGLTEIEIDNILNQPDIIDEIQHGFDARRNPIEIAKEIDYDSILQVSESMNYERNLEPHRAMKIGWIHTLKEGDRVKLLANEEENWEEERGEVIGLDIDRDVIMVKVDSEFLNGPGDDGFREVTQDQIARETLIRENIEFERGLEPAKAMKMGWGDLFIELKKLIPDVIANMDDNGNIFIPYETSTEEQRDLIWKHFDREDTEWFLTDDAGPNFDSIGLIVQKDTIYEAKKKPTTAKGKEKKFGKVMKEFGKGKLTPYHAKSSLKSKKQDGTKEEHKQALAIAFSEAGMKKESVEKDKEIEETVQNVVFTESFYPRIELFENTGELKPFEEVQPGDKAVDYADTRLIVVDKGTRDEMNYLNIGSQAELYDIDIDEEDDQWIAVKYPLGDDYNSFDHHKGDTIVYLYGYDGAYVPKE